MNQVESTSSDSSNGLVNGLVGENVEPGTLSVVKKHKKTNQFRSSASSQGSGIRDELTMGDSSSSSTSSADEVEHQISTDKRRKKNRKLRSAIHRQADDEDDERTDSADEEEDSYANRPHPPQSFPTGHVVTYDSNPSSILKPLSPMLAVGYGAELMMTCPQPSQREFVTQAAIESPHQSDGHGSSTGPMSPEMSSALVHGTPSVNTESENSILSLVPSSSLPPNLSTTGGPLSNGTTSVLNPSSSISAAAAANALPFAGWWGQPPPLYSPFCGPSGSVATTPVATDGSSLRRPGSTALLPAVICQESEGVLIVNVQWRNKSFSGSLIDVSQHQWAPPRLAESFQEIPIQIKDLYSKQDSEKEAVEVTIDDEKEEELEDMEAEAPHKQEASDEETKPPPPPPTSSDESKALAEKTGSQDDVITNTPSKSTPMLVKPPNGLQVPAIINVPSSGNLNSVKPVLPAFDAVKSPQPQIGRDDNEVSARKRDHTPHTAENKASVDSSTLSEAHHNLNTLVDVAAKMKPVSNNSSSPTPHKMEGRGKPGEEVKGFGSFASGKTQPPSGNDSDSSGSGSISPVRKSQYHQSKNSSKQIKSEPPTVGGTKPPDAPPTVSSAMPFQLQSVSLQPISPGEETHDNSRQIKKSGSGKQTASGYPWVPPQEHAGEKKPPTMVVPSIISFNSSNPGDHTPPFPSQPSTSVIQDKHRQKRKRPNVSEPSKRPSPPLKDRESPAHGERMVPAPLSIGAKSALTQRDSIATHMHLVGPENFRQIDTTVPPGFIFDPSLPMPLNLQVLSFERQKAAEADRSIDRRTPPKVPKKMNSPYDHLAPHDNSSHASSRSPPHPSVSTKRSSHSKMPPGVVMQPEPHRITGITGGGHHIKQESQIPSQPSRPSSKGGISSHGTPNSTIKNPSSHSSRKPLPSSGTNQPRRSEQVLVKQEPLDHQATLLQQIHHPQQAIVSFPGFPGPGTNYPAVVISSAPSSSIPNPIQAQQIHGIHSQPPGWSGVISGTTPHMPSSQSHGRTHNDLSVSSRASNARTPSPNPHKKPSSDWPSHPAVINHQSSSLSLNSIKHEPGSSRQHTDSAKHNIGPAHAGSSSSSHSHRSNKHESSSRHSQSTSSHPLPPQAIPSLPPHLPPTAAAAAGAQVLSPSHIAALRSGVSEDWMKQFQIMEVLKSNLVSPAQALPTPIHPQDLALWQNQMAAQMAAMQHLPLDQAAALQMQLALQHQQQQQQTETVNALAAQGFLPLVQPFPVAGAQVFPSFPLAQAPKTQER